jgi:hypothetical protein
MGGGKGTGKEPDHRFKVRQKMDDKGGKGEWPSGHSCPWQRATILVCPLTFQAVDTLSTMVERTFHAGILLWQVNAVILILFETALLFCLSVADSVRVFCSSHSVLPKPIETVNCSTRCKHPLSSVDVSLPGS